MHVAVFFLRKDMLLCNYTRVVFSIDRYKLRDNRVQKQKPKYFFFLFWKMRHSKKTKKKRGSKSTSRCRLMLDNFKFHFRTPLTIISADSRRTQNNNSQFIFSSPKNWKMLLQMLLFFGWNCRRVSLFVCVRTSVDRHRAAAASPSCTWHPSHIPASFLLVHWSFSLHHLALDFQPMCVGFFSCPLSSGAAFRLKLWFAFHDMATCNHELLFLKCRITSRNISRVLTTHWHYLKF